MPRLYCTAVTCRHNSGNLDGKYPVLGSFLCCADEVEYAETEGKCEQCGLDFDTLDCLTYERHMR